MSSDVDPSWLAAIAGWLPGRRWFAGKQLTLRSVAADAAVPITLGGTRESDIVWVLAVRVAFEHGPDQRYALPVAVSTAERSGLTGDDVRVIARLDGDRLLVDAMALPETAAIVVGVAFAGDRFEHDGARVHGCPRRERLVAHPSLMRPLSVEQSNSSVAVGDAHIAKLVRRLEPGVNPDAELTEHLTRHGFAHGPCLAATLELHLGLDGATADHGAVDVLVVHDMVANEGDLWSTLVQQVERELLAGDWFDDRHLALAELLGRRTAELHAALAAPVDEWADADTATRMRPVPFDEARQAALLSALHANLRATQRALSDAGHIVGATPVLDRAREAGLLDGDPELLLARFEALRTHVVDAMEIRVHGDLHLGQVLAVSPTADDGAPEPDIDVVFIDFEGEPGLPIADRVVKRSSLTDVAGLLRSIDYLGRQALHLAAVAGGVPHERRDEAEAARVAWTKRLCDGVVESYLATLGPAHVAPTDRADADLLLDLYLLDKGLYEIRYELANRPEWVGAPLAAVTEMITR